MDSKEFSPCFEEIKKPAEGPAFLFLPGGFCCFYRTKLMKTAKMGMQNIKYLLDIKHLLSGQFIGLGGNRNG